MNLLSPFKIPQTGGLDKPLNVHRFLEALKFAFGARSWVTDPAYVAGKDRDRLDEIWTKEWADAVRPKIQDVSVGRETTKCSAVQRHAAQRTGRG